MKLLGVDYGGRNIGIAVSDSSGFLASGLKNIHNANFLTAAKEVAALARSLNAEKIVVGYPKNMDGSVGPAARTCADFAKEIKQHFQGEVILWDERCTTISAHRFLSETNTRGQKRKDVVDRLAASIILQSYLDR